MSERKRVRAGLHGPTRRTGGGTAPGGAGERAGERGPGTTGDGGEERGGGETILLAEDEAVIRSLLVEILERDGYRVLTTSGGPEALSVAAAHRGEIRLLVSDVVMPGMDGRELAEQLATILPDIRVLFISGYATDEVSRRGVLPVDTPFLRKPFSPRELLRKVREILEAPR